MISGRSVGGEFSGGYFLFCFLIMCVSIFFPIYCGECDQESDLEVKEIGVGIYYILTRRFDFV